MSGLISTSWTPVWTRSRDPVASRPGRLNRVVETLERSHGVSVSRLRGSAGIRQEAMTPVQAAATESDFDALEREADRGRA